MKTRLWKYLRRSRQDFATSSEAKRAVPRGYEFYRSTVGEYVFRKRLPAHEVGARIDRAHTVKL